MGSFKCATFMLCAAILAGCATSQNLAHDMVPYGGFWSDITFHRQSEDVVGIGPVMAAVDAPLSLIGDTATLPITMCAATSRWIESKKDEAVMREWRRAIAPEQSEPE